MRLELPLEGILCEIISAPFSGCVSFLVHDSKVVHIDIKAGPDNECSLDLLYERISRIWGPAACHGYVCN